MKKILLIFMALISQLATSQNVQCQEVLDCEKLITVDIDKFEGTKKEYASVRLDNALIIISKTQKNEMELGIHLDNPICITYVWTSIKILLKDANQLEYPNTISDNCEGIVMATCYLNNKQQIENFNKIKTIPIDAMRVQVGKRGEGGEVEKMGKVDIELTEEQGIELMQKFNCVLNR